LGFDRSLAQPEACRALEAGRVEAPALYHRARAGESTNPTLVGGVKHGRREDEHVTEGKPTAFAISRRVVDQLELGEVVAFGESERALAGRLSEPARSEHNGEDGRPDCSSDDRRETRQERHLLFGVPQPVVPTR
jgi:hypothetical protein